MLQIIATNSKNRYKNVVCKQFASQIRPHTVWGLIWDPNCLPILSSWCKYLPMALKELNIFSPTKSQNLISKCGLKALCEYSGMCIKRPLKSYFQIDVLSPLPHKSAFQHTCETQLSNAPLTALTFDLTFELEGWPWPFKPSKCAAP